MTAESFAREGWSVLLLDVQACDATLQACQALRVEAEQVIGDLTAEETVTEAVETVQRRWKRVDALVNNAGISSIAPAELTEVATFRRVLEVNLVAPFLLSKGFGRLMLHQAEGAIVNVASIAGLVGVSDRSAYNASKHGLVGLTRSLAAEWGGRGVRVNAVCPGWVKTEMDAADQAGGGYNDDDIKGRVPMARFASPDDVANAILFLADGRRSGFVNGHTLTVDGGWTADGSWESLRMRKR
ncbi:MAG: hypothetical protein NVSMB3_02950 [Acidobacteriaceae bacterium]